MGYSEIKRGHIQISRQCAIKNPIRGSQLVMKRWDFNRISGWRTTEFLVMCVWHLCPCSMGSQTALTWLKFFQIHWNLWKDQGHIVYWIIEIPPYKIIYIDVFIFKFKWSYSHSCDVSWQKNKNWEKDSELQFPAQDGTVWLLCKQLSPLNEEHFYREAV